MKIAAIAYQNHLKFKFLNSILTQFHGGKIKSEDEAEKRWRNGFWNLRETVQKVWKRNRIFYISLRFVFKIFIVFWILIYSNLNRFEFILKFVFWLNPTQTVPRLILKMEKNPNIEQQLQYSFFAEFSPSFIT